MHDWHKRTGKTYLTSGIGYGKTELSAFDAAERDANIMAANAIKVSSFIPPRWQIVNDKEELGKYTDKGIFLPMAYAYAASGDCKAAASIVVGTNKDGAEASIIIEHADVNLTGQQSLEKSMLCLQDVYSSRNWSFEGVEQIVAEGVPEKKGYVCVLVAAVFLVDQF